MCKNGVYQNYNTFLKNIMADCPKHAKEIESEYYEARLEMVKYCSKDSVTGEKCGEVRGQRPLYYLFEHPYKNWEPYQCEISTSCLAEFDAVLREYGNFDGCYYKYENPHDCHSFKKYNNPIESCSNPNYVDEGPSSDAIASTLINNQIVLFSLIMCLIFALFK